MGTSVPKQLRPRNLLFFWTAGGIQLMESYEGFQGSFDDEEVGYDERTDCKIGNSSFQFVGRSVFGRIGANNRPWPRSHGPTERSDGGRAGTAAGFPASGSAGP